MRLPTLQTLTWFTVAASIACALLLADHADSGLPLFGSRSEQATPLGADERQARPADHAAALRRGNGHSQHPRRGERDARRGPR